MASTKNVINHHLKCFGERDLQGVLSDYAPGAVMFTPNGPLQGVHAIRPMFQAMIAEFGKPGATFSIEGENLRPVTVVVLDEVKSGDWGIGGNSLTTADAKALAAGKAKG